MLQQETRKAEEVYKSMACVLASAVEFSRKIINGYSRNVADHALILSISLCLNNNEVNNIYYAGLLHDLGTVFLPNEVFLRPIKFLTQSDKELLQQGPWLSQVALISIAALKESALIILQHQEKLDGSGYPEKLKGDDILFAARILGVIVDYHKIINGLFYLEEVKPQDALAYLKQKFRNSL